jgi:hypothetical protein
MLIFTTLHGSRRVERPPVRWLKNFEEDLRRTGVGIWKRMAKDREKRKSITEGVKAENRL